MFCKLWYSSALLGLPILYVEQEVVPGELPHVKTQITLNASKTRVFAKLPIKAVPYSRFYQIFMNFRYKHFVFKKLSSVTGGKFLQSKLIPFLLPKVPHGLLDS